MRTGRTRGRRGLLVATAATAAMAMLAPTWAAAEPGMQPPWAVGDTVEGPAPAEAIAELADCPAPADFPADFNPFLCLKLTAYDGELKLGNTIASVDGPLSITVGVGLNNSFESVIVPGTSSGGGPAAVPISGGILGIPALDPIIALDPIGLLSVSATPQLGSAGVNGGPEGAFGFLGWLLGEDAFEANLALPVSIKLNNLLMGPNCRIPEFTMNLTSGTSTPPEGVEPLTGSDGTTVNTTYTGPPFSLWVTKAGAELVGNDFAVSGPTNCDILGGIGNLLGKPNTGLLDTVIGNQVGLPSPAGNNYAKFKVDTLTARYDLLQQATLTSPGVEGNEVQMPSTVVGSTSTAIARITNTGLKAIRPSLETAGPGLTQFNIDNDPCSGNVLAAGASCDVTVEFRPTSPNPGHSMILRLDGAGGGQNLTFRGEATAAAAATVAAAPASTRTCKPLLGIRLC